jgi:hypothetical protein
VNQAELQQMATERIKDAEALLSGGRWEFAYYTAGYAIECALKSCVLSRMILTGWVFKEDVKRVVDDCRTHDFMKLVVISGLLDELNDAKKASAAAKDKFDSNWQVVRLWAVTSRYESKTESEARDLVAAIVDDPDGVLQWIRNYW